MRQFKILMSQLPSYIVAIQHNNLIIYNENYKSIFDIYIAETKENIYIEKITTIQGLNNVF